MGDNIQESFTYMMVELRAAEDKFPGWPRDIVHGAAIIQEECGELVKACLDYYYGRGSRDAVENEAHQTGAMVFRFLAHIKQYKPELKEGDL